jgi:uncharacterized protein (TIGR02246 family)
MSDAAKQEREIHRLVATYADAVGRRDDKTWGDTWADDGIWEVLGQRPQGRDEIVELFLRLMSGFPMIVQIASGGLVDVDGERATGRWYITEYAMGGAAPLFNLGHYHDRYVKQGDVWRFAERRFSMIYSGPPDLSAKPLPIASS